MSLDGEIQLAAHAAVDPEVRNAVPTAYRSARALASSPHAKFNAALESYCKAYPDISAPAARHAVARVIPTDG